MVKYQIMSIRYLLGKIRRKFLRIFLGADLFNWIDRCEYKKLDEVRELNANITKQIDRLGYESRSWFHEMITHIYNAALVKEINTKTFAKYRCLYKNQDIVLLGTGPTAKYYDPIDNAVTIGTNGAVFFDKVKLDYLFVTDYMAMKNIEQEVLDYKCRKFFTFLGSQPNRFPVKFKDLPDVEEFCGNIVGLINGVGFLNNDNYVGHSIPLDICNAPLTTFASVIFYAVQFALWTYPKRIFVVGCDCTTGTGAHFYEKTDESAPVMNHWVIGWQRIKEFQQTYYPDVEIISVNPKGLKGIFKDIYTDSYLAMEAEND